MYNSHASFTPILDSWTSFTSFIYLLFSMHLFLHFLSTASCAFFLENICLLGTHKLPTSYFIWTPSSLGWSSNSNPKSFLLTIVFIITSSFFHLPLMMLKLSIWFFGLLVLPFISWIISTLQTKSHILDHSLNKS